MHETMHETIAARIAELEAERDAFITQANTQIAAYGAVIAELRRLLNLMEEPQREEERATSD